MINSPSCRFCVDVAFFGISGTIGLNRFSLLPSMRLRSLANGLSVFQLFDDFGKSNFPEFGWTRFKMDLGNGDNTRSGKKYKQKHYANR